MNVLKNIICLWWVIPCLGVVLNYDYNPSPSYAPSVIPGVGGYYATANNMNNEYNSRNNIDYQPSDPYQAFFGVTTPAPTSTAPSVESNEDKVSTTMNPSNVTIEELISECVDLYEQCPDFAKHNYCVKFRKQMLFQCRKSCDFCDLHPLENSTDDDESDDDSSKEEDVDPTVTNTNSDNESDDDDESSNNNTVKPETNDTSDDDNDNNTSDDDNNNNNSDENNNKDGGEDDDNDTSEPEAVEKIKKSPSGKKHKIILKPRSPIYEKIINDDSNKNFGSGFSKNSYKNLKERFHIPGYEPTAEEIYAETGQIAASSLENHKNNKRMFRKSKRNFIPKIKKSSDPYEYLKTMDNTKESMQPIKDSRKHPENSSLFKSSVDSIKQFFYPRTKRSGPSSENHEISHNQATN